jgi:hypothetical protein
MNQQCFSCGSPELRVVVGISKRVVQCSKCGICQDDLGSVVREVLRQAQTDGKFQATCGQFEDMPEVLLLVTCVAKLITQHGWPMPTVGEIRQSGTLFCYWLDDTGGLVLSLSTTTLGDPLEVTLEDGPDGVKHTSEFYDLTTEGIEGRVICEALLYAEHMRDGAESLRSPSSENVRD